MLLSIPSECLHAAFEHVCIDERGTHLAKECGAAFSDSWNLSHKGGEAGAL